MSQKKLARGTRAWVALGLALVGVVALVVAYTRRNHAEDALYAIGGHFADAESADTHVDAFASFRVGHAYLWLGIGTALLFSALVVVRAKRNRLVTVGLGIASVGALMAALLQRDDADSTLGNIEGAYFNDSVGTPVPRSILAFGSHFDPFQWGNAYLWAGIAFGLLAGLVASLAADRTSPAAASQDG